MPQPPAVVHWGNILADACASGCRPGRCERHPHQRVGVRQGSKVDPQWCGYHAAAGATVTISLASGDEGKFAWDFAANPSNGRMDQLVGVGDSALQGRGGTVIVARKGDLVCSVDLTGTDNADGMTAITPDRGETLANKLGALCAKIFAARG